MEKPMRIRQKQSGIRYLAAIILIVISPVRLFAPPAISLKVTGKWQAILRATDLTGGAGTDYQTPFESAVDEVKLTITKTAGPTAPWRIDIRRTDVNWDADLTLYAKRSSDGTGDGTISGGTTYQAVTTTDQSFFTGTGDRSQIGLQYQIDGFSVNNLQVDTYETTIYITVTET